MAVVVVLVAVLVLPLGSPMRPTSLPIAGVHRRAPVTRPLLYTLAPKALCRRRRRRGTVHGAGPDTLIPRRVLLLNTSSAVFNRFTAKSVGRLFLAPFLLRGH